MQRDALVIGAVLLIAVIIGGWLVFFGMGTDTSQNDIPQDVSFSVLGEGANAQLSERKNYRIKNRDEFAMIWSYAYGSGPEQLPSVDFTQNHVLAVFSGERPSAGYGVAVNAVVDTATAREVMITHTEPGTGCMTAQVITSPFQFVLVPKNELPIVRTDFTVVTECE